MRFIDPVDRLAFADFIDKILGSSFKQTCELKLLKNERNPVYIHIEGIVDDGNKIQGRQLRIAIIDIADRNRAEEALRESEKKFRALADGTPNGILVYRDNRILYVNPAIVSISEYTKEELLTIDFIDLIHPDYRDVIKEGIKARMGQWETCTL